MRKQIFVPLILGAAFLCSSCVKSTVPKETKAQVVNIETYTAELEATPVPFVTEIPEAGSQKMSENDIRLIALILFIFLIRYMMWFINRIIFLLCGMDERNGVK